MNISYSQKMEVFFSSIPFLKDSLEWRRIYYVLRDYSDKNDMKFDDIKLLYITILSLESVLKAVVILESPQEVVEKKTINFLKSMSHNLIKIYKKIEVWLKEKDGADLGKAFSEEEKKLIEKWSEYAKDIKYKMDAFIDYWLKVKWVSSLTWAFDGENLQSIDVEVYEHILWKMIRLWQIITHNKYWRNAELAYIKSLDEESTLKISNEDYNSIKAMYGKNK